MITESLLNVLLVCPACFLLRKIPLNEILLQPAASIVTCKPSSEATHIQSRTPLAQQHRHMSYHIHKPTNSEKMFSSRFQKNASFVWFFFGTIRCTHESCLNVGCGEENIKVSPHLLLRRSNNSEVRRLVFRWYLISTSVFIRYHVHRHSPSILHPSSCILHPSSFTLHHSSLIIHHSSSIIHHSPLIFHHHHHQHHHHHHHHHMFFSVISGPLPPASFRATLSPGFWLPGENQKKIIRKKMSRKKIKAR